MRLRATRKTFWRKKGALLRVSPEEISTAFIMAIARDIKRQDPEEIIQQWKKLMLNTSCRFVRLEDQWKRYWHSLSLRETLDHTYKACVRTCYQRVLEVIRLIDHMKESMHESKVTAARVEKEYRENLKNMNNESNAAITINFVDTALTVRNRMLVVPGVQKIIEDMEEKCAQSADMVNPFNSHTRLQAMIDKTGEKTKDLLWCCEALTVRCLEGDISTISANDIRGHAGTSNRGLLDVFLMKRSLREEIVAKGKDMFNAEGRKWIETVVSHHIESFMTWNAQEKSNDLGWRANRKPSEIMWLNVLIAVVFKQDYDTTIKGCMKSGESPAEMLRSGLAPAWDPIQEKRSAGKTEEDSRIPVDAVSDADADEEKKDSETLGDGEQGVPPLQFVMPNTESSEGGAGKLVKLSELDEESQGVVNNIVKDARLQLRATVCLLPQDSSKDALREQLSRATALVDSSNTSAIGYVGIFFDPKRSGEPQYRPYLRTAAIREDTYTSIIKVILNRHSVTTDEIGERDVYFLMDGNKPGASSDLLNIFSGKDKSVKPCTIFKDEESMLDRYGKVQGIGTVRLDEGLFIVSQKRLLCPRTQFRNFNGSNAGNIIGPVVMPPLEKLWELTWQRKLAVYGAKNFVQGGKLPDDQEELECNKCSSARTPDSKEPVCYHSYPEALYHDMLAAYHVKVVIDLTPGEGMLALTCHKRGIPYHGLVFNAAHRDELQTHLDQLLVGSLLEANTETYNVRLHTTLLATMSEDDKKKAGVGKGGGRECPKRGGKTKASRIWPRPRPKKKPKKESEAAQEEEEEEPPEEDEEPDDCSGEDGAE